MSEEESDYAVSTVSQLVSWCFKPSQPQRIISGLKETFIKRYIIARTNTAEIKPEEQSEKAENCWDNFCNETHLKGPQRQKQTQEQSKKEWASSAGLCQKHEPQHPHHVKVSPRGGFGEGNKRLQEEVKTQAMTNQTSFSNTAKERKVKIFFPEKTIWMTAMTGSQIADQL